MSENALAVEIRTTSGKGVARKLRSVGRIPAVLYGHGNDPTPLSIEARRLDAILKSSDRGMNTLIDLTGDAAIDGKMVMVKDLQREPIRGGMLHADLLEVVATDTVHVAVPVHLKGIPKGVTLSGGLLDQVLREIDLDCLPGAIPEELVLDVSELDLGDSLHVRDIALPKGVTLQTDGDLSVVSVAVAAAAVEETVTEAAEEGEAPAEGAEGAEAAEPSSES